MRVQVNRDLRSHLAEFSVVIVAKLLIWHYGIVNSRSWSLANGTRTDQVRFKLEMDHNQGRPPFSLQMQIVGLCIVKKYKM